MAAPIAEIAAITVQGRRWEYWSAVKVSRDIATTWVIEAIVTATEVGADPPGWATQRLRVGDRASVHLAGRLTCKGRIAVRQSSAMAQPPTHGLQVQIMSLTRDLVTASAPLREFRNQPLSAIAQQVIAPFGIPLVMRASGVAAMPFDRVHVRPGESVAELLERLGRQRGIRFYDTPQGQLIGDDFSRQLTETGAALVEGQNIISAQAILRDDFAHSRVDVNAQRAGNEATGHWGDLARNVSAFATNPAVNRHVPLLIAEGAMDQVGARERAQAEIRANALTQANVHVTTQGWLSGGRLWLEMVGETIMVIAPSVLPEPMKLAIAAVVHQQDDRTGTTTTVSMVLPHALQRIASGLPPVPQQFGGNPTDAQDNPDQPQQPPSGDAWPQPSDSNWDGAGG